MASRGVLYLTGNAWFWQLRFMDDYVWVAGGDFMLHDVLLAITCLAAWGFPFSWKSLEEGWRSLESAMGPI